MLGHIEDKRRKLLLLEKSLLNALCAAFDPFEICARSWSCALVDIREGLLRADTDCVQSRQVGRSVHGTKRTLMAALSMSALEGEADMAGSHPNVRL
jgi:hypothetical protein